MAHSKHSYAQNILVPCLFFSALTGIATGIVVFLFKYLAGLVIEASAYLYGQLALHPGFIPLGIPLLCAVVLFSDALMRLCPSTQGGGIPTAIQLLRGVSAFRWLRSLLGTFVASLVTFFTGVPLGNEGPCVLMGTAIGDGMSRLPRGQARAWRRYVMTGGASCGFAVATGAPVSGIFFALEEAHQRFSPMLIMTATSCVTFGMITQETLSTLFHIRFSLFDDISPLPLRLSQLWIPMIVGVSVGLFSVAFLRLYKLIDKGWRVSLRRLDRRIKLALIYSLTFIGGLLLPELIGTGHDLLLGINKGQIAWYLLLVILILRSLLTLCANNTGITGGVFVPMLSLGACLSALVARAMIAAEAVGPDYYVTIVVLGLSATLASMIKTPITAIIFALELLGGVHNILYITIAVLLAYLVTEVFHAASINDSILSTKLEELHQGRSPLVIDTFVTVLPHTFAEGKAIRDILWPCNLFVLSVQPNQKEAVVDKEGDKHLHAGDRLHVRFQTYDLDRTRLELFAIVGEQEIDTDIVQSI